MYNARAFFLCYNIYGDFMEYIIKRKKIKNYILKIYPNLKIEISVPLKTTDKDIENFINSKKDWINKTIQKIKERESLSTPKKEKGIKILGREVEIKVIESELERIRLAENFLYIYTEKISHENIKKLLLSWQENKLKEILEKYLDKYLVLLNTKINYYKIKKLSSAWGIYHSRENYISFNFDLIKKDEDFIEYVVLHELCHIFHMDHQKGFWNLVAKFLPNYKEIREKGKYI